MPNGECPVTYSANWTSHRGLFFTVGLPRSGKSTLVKDWISHYPGRVHIDVDTFREVIHGKVYHRNSEPHVWAAATTATKALLADGYNVLFDDTNSTKWSQERLFEIDPNAQYVLVRTEPSICHQRARRTHPDYLDGYSYIINKVAKHLENNLDIESVREYIQSEYFN